MLMRYPLAGVILCVVCIVFSVSVTIAAECQQRDNFSDWLEHFRQEATSQGISQQTIVSALNGITYDPAIITHDHSQKVFQQSFEEFSGRMVSPDRLRKGANMLKRYGSIAGCCPGMPRRWLISSTARLKACDVKPRAAIKGGNLN